MQFSKFLYQTHRWFGVHFGLLTFVFCFTGTLAVLGNEWDLWSDSGRRAETTETNWQALETTLHERFPEYRVQSISTPKVQGMATSAILLSPRGQLLEAYFEPESGEFLSLRSRISIKYYLRQYHRGFWLSASIMILGTIGFLLIYWGSSGIKLIPQLLLSLRRIRMRKGEVLKWLDLHRFFGLWSLAFTLMIGLTVAWYQVEAIAARGYGARLTPEVPTRVKAELVQVQSQSRWPLAALVQRAKEGKFWTIADAFKVVRVN